MSSLFGLVHLDQRPINMNAAESAAAALHHRGEITFEGLLQSGFFLSLRQQTGGVSAASVFKSQFGFGSGAFEGISFSSSVKSVADAFMQMGSDRAMVLPGELSAVCLSESQRRVSLFRDPVGLRPLYYYWNGSAKNSATLAISSELPKR